MLVIYMPIVVDYPPNMVPQTQIYKMDHFEFGDGRFLTFLDLGLVEAKLEFKSNLLLTKYNSLDSNL